MSDHDSARNALFRPVGTAELPDRPALLGGQCQSCGFVFFPLQSYGCENCGSVALQGKALTGRGTLVASAEVHIHAGGGRIAPFTVGSIVTEDGAFIRALLDQPAGQHLTPGIAMDAVLVPETRPDHGSMDFRFRVAGTSN